MDRLVAPLVLHLRLELPPLLMVAGLALKLLIVGGFGFGFGGAVPVTVTESNRAPRLPLE
jgi:hypothetical protein